MKEIEFLKENGVDIDKCLELFGDIETYNETLQGFCKSLESKLKQLDTFHKEEDMSNYSIIVHSIKSDSKYFGFMKFANICFEHEMASKDNDVKFVNKQYDELTEEARKVQQVVNEYLASISEIEKLDDNENSSDTGFSEISLETLSGDEEIEQLESEEIHITKVDIDNSDNITGIHASTLIEEEPDVLNEDIILVADDSEVVRIFVKKIFDADYEIAHASNGIEALKIIQEHEIDGKIKAILLDLNMPKKDGFAVLDYMVEKDLLEIMPVTIISGDCSKEAISRAFTYDIVDMINKPFSEQKIKEAVEKTMNSIN